LLLTSMLVSLFAAAPAGATIPSADLRQDARLLRRAFETLHPGLHRYATPAEISDAFAALDAEFSRDRTLAEAYLAISRLTARVRCGHTYPNFFNQRKAVAEPLFESTRRVPFFFRWLDGKMVVTRSFAADPRLAPGAEVAAIDGVPAATILARLLPLVRADGGNDAKRVSLLEVQGRGRYEAFDVYFPLLFPSTATTLELRVRGPGRARAERVIVPAQTAADRRRAVEASREGSAPDAPLWTLEYADDIAVWRMPTWSTYNTKWDWKQALAQGFADVVARRPRALVLDLRENEGGTDAVADSILAHLGAEPVPLRKVTERVRYRRVPEDLAPYLDTWDPSFKDWGARAVEEADGFYRLTEEDAGAVASAPPATSRYSGPVFVLTSAVNSSATFAFVQAVKEARLATLVGEPTGGNQRGTNGGAFFFLRLPRTGIEVDVPLIGYFPEGTPPDAGIVPDVIVTPRPSDIAAGKDAALDAVRARLAAPKR
jgi:C-terminal processing protease CtpA/Prc